MDVVIEMKKLREEGHTLENVCEITGLPKRSATLWLKGERAPSSNMAELVLHRINAWKNNSEETEVFPEIDIANKNQVIDSEVFTELQQSVDSLISMQRHDGYWWFTLEANETIGSEFIFLMHFLDEWDNDIAYGISRRILDRQREDGTWALYWNGPADLSTTLECYLALRMSGYSKNEPNMKKALDFIIKEGGAENSRVFTLIHLAMMDLIPWSACPEMPAELILAPTWQPFNIYEFSSWARATVVPLLVVVSLKFKKKLSIDVDEIFKSPKDKRKYKQPDVKNMISFENMVTKFDKLLKISSNIAPKKFRNYSINKCLSWIRDHIAKTEDIYPALAYGAMAFKAAGYPNTAMEIKKPFEALKMFQQIYIGPLPCLPDELPDDGKTILSDLRGSGTLPARQTGLNTAIHQQCCISPVWDTPWSALALLSAGLSPSHPALKKTARWLLSKQITDTKGDWAIKVQDALPGGWAFEFENDYFPDVDDTVAVLSVLHQVDIPKEEKEEAIERGLNWLIAMQSKNGGWGAFDKDNTREWVNRIPFSDHKACLDDPSPDITSRIIELFAMLGKTDHPCVKKAIKYLENTQKDFGGWFARWGINFLYGTWCVTTAYNSLGRTIEDPQMKKAADWLLSIQNEDGGFGESPESYDAEKYIHSESCPSQTAWGLMALTALGLSDTDSAKRATNYLLDNRDENGLWSEENYTGTGFPMHFYIRYHGYARYFPLLALGKWMESLEK